MAEIFEKLLLFLLLWKSNWICFQSLTKIVLINVSLLKNSVSVFIYLIPFLIFVYKFHVNLFEYHWNTLMNSAIGLHAVVTRTRLLVALTIVQLGFGITKNLLILLLMTCFNWLNTVKKRMFTYSWSLKYIFHITARTILSVCLCECVYSFCMWVSWIMLQMW